MAAALQSHGRDLTFGSVPRHLVVFSMPMMLGEWRRSPASRFGDAEITADFASEKLMDFGVTRNG